MTDLITYLNALKDRLAIKSVNQLAIRLGISQSTMDAIMKGKMIPKEEICEKIATLANDKPEIIIALAGKSRAKKDMKKYWDNLLKSASAATFLILFLLPSFVNASTIFNSSRSLYIMFNRFFRVINRTLKKSFSDPTPFFINQLDKFIY